MPHFSELFVFYVFVISLIAVVITIVDKKLSKKKRKKKKRIPEMTLMLIGLFGGALPMYITMRAIRHKTRHKKFMIGLPLEIALHVILLLWYVF